MSTWCDECERPFEGERCDACGFQPDGTPTQMTLMWKVFIFGTGVYVVWRIYQLIHWLSKP